MWCFLPEHDSGCRLPNDYDNGKRWVSDDPLVVGVVWHWKLYYFCIPLFYIKENYYSKKNNLTTWRKNLQFKNPILEEKLIICIINISLNVYLATVVFDSLFFFAVFKLCLCFKQKKYTKHAQMQPTLQHRRYNFRKTADLILVKIL